jgi:hypothetical protein
MIRNGPQVSEGRFAVYGLMRAHYMLACHATTSV